MSFAVWFELIHILLQVYNALGNATAAPGIILALQSSITQTVSAELAKTCSTNFSFSSYQPGDGLSGVVKNIDNALVDANYSSMILSFLDGNQARLWQEIASYRNVGYLGFNAINCEMTLSTKDGISTCKHYPSGHLVVTKALLDYFQFKKIAIISSGDICEKKFANKLYDRVYNSQKKLFDDAHEYMLIRKYTFSADRLNTRELESIIYDIKFLQVSTIILVCQGELAKIMFKVATKYSILGYDKVWITTDYRYSENARILPFRHINIFGGQENGAVWKSEQVVNMSLMASRMANGISATDRNACLRKNDTKKMEGKFDNLSREFVKMSCPISEQHSVRAVYSPKIGEWVEIMSWKQKTGVVLSSENTELHKIFSPPSSERVLTVVTLLDQPFTARADHYYKKNRYKEYACEFGLLCSVPVITGNKTIWQSTCCIGHSVELLQTLAKDLYFTPKVYVVEDGYYGSKENGKWNGMIGDVYTKKADLAVSGLTITNTRLAVVDFTGPYMKAEIGIIISTKNKQQKTLNFSFLDYMTETLLWCLFGVFTIGLILVYCFENLRTIFIKRQHRIRKHCVYSWKEGFTYFSGLTFQRDLGGKNPSEYGARLTAIVFAFCMVIAMTAYTAVLTASSVKQEERNPFLGIKDPRMRNPTDDFKFGTVSATATENFFRYVPDPVLHRMYFFMKKYNKHYTIEGVQAVLSGKLHGFVNENTYLKYHVSKQRDCSLKLIDMSLDYFSYGLVLPKGSRWKHPISNAILKYRESGLILKLQKKWLSGTCYTPNNRSSQHSSYSATHFSGLFLILLSSSIFALVILGFEHAYGRYHEKVAAPIESSWNKLRKLGGKRENSTETQTAPEDDAFSRESPNDNIVIETTP